MIVNELVPLSPFVSLISAGVDDARDIGSDRGLPPLSPFESRYLLGA